MPGICVRAFFRALGLGNVSVYADAIDRCYNISLHSPFNIMQRLFNCFSFFLSAFFLVSFFFFLMFFIFEADKMASKFFFRFGMIPKIINDFHFLISSELTN